MTGRNASCPCGSGKKYKRCCLDKPVDYGPCIRCGEAGCGARLCKVCGKKYAHCHEHQADSLQTMKGHVLRIHPESVPDVVDRLMRNEVALADVRAQYERDPEMWKRLIEYIASWQN